MPDINNFLDWLCLGIVLVPWCILITFYFQYAFNYEKLKPVFHNTAFYSEIYDPRNT